VRRVTRVRRHRHTWTVNHNLGHHVNSHNHILHARPPAPSHATSTTRTRYQNWDLDDPAGLTVEAVRPIREELERRVRRLLGELQITAG
jgi:hypothetical protein